MSIFTRICAKSVLFLIIIGCIGFVYASESNDAVFQKLGNNYGKMTVEKSMGLTLYIAGENEEKPEAIAESTITVQAKTEDGFTEITLFAAPVKGDRKGKSSCFEGVLPSSLHEEEVKLFAKIPINGESYRATFEINEHGGHDDDNKGHDDGHDKGHSHKGDGEDHAHKSPHGGVLQTIGDYHVELVVKSRQSVVLNLLESDKKTGIEISDSILNATLFMKKGKKDFVLGATNSGKSSQFTGLLPSAMDADEFTVKVKVKIMDKKYSPKFSFHPEPEEQFACPMRCEKGKTYSKAGKCPVCKMKLKEKKEGHHNKDGGGHHGHHND